MAYHKDLEEPASRIIKLLKETDTPLTFEEIVEKSGVDKTTTKRIMWRLVHGGFIKSFLREDEGELKAVYIMVG